MAVKRVAKLQSDPTSSLDKLGTTLGASTWTVEKKKVIAGAAIVLALVGLWWYKTKTWPVAAVVNYQPITRYQIEKSLFGQGGAQAADNLITEALVKQELAKLRVAPSEAEIDAKVEDIKKGLQEGQELDKLLADSGMTMAQLRERIRMQLGVEKVATDSAKISEWLDGLKTKARIWRFF